MANVTELGFDRIAAAFSDRRQAEAAVADLRKLGLTDERIGVAVLEPGRYDLEDTTGDEMLEGVERGIAVGAPIGSLAGLGLISFAVPGAGVLGLGGMLVLGLIGGGLWGTFLGAFGGLTAKVRMDDTRDRWCEIPMGEKDVLVVVEPGDQPGNPAHQVREVLEQHGARCFLEPEEIGAQES